MLQNLILFYQNAQADGRTFRFYWRSTGSVPGVAIPSARRHSVFLGRVLMYKSFLFFILMIVFTACVRPPEKLDPNFVILQYLSKSNSSNDSGNISDGTGAPVSGGANAPVACPNPALVFNPGGIIDTGQTTCWDAAGTGVACLGTGQDGAFANIPNARSFVGPTQHCIYTNDYTTLDQFHGLTWKTCAEGQSGAACGTGVSTQLSWTAATAIPAPVGSCGALNTQNGGNGYAGRTDWRLPTVKELASLFHYSNAPQIDVASFPATFSGIAYMTNSTVTGTPTNIWVADFSGVAILKTYSTPKGANLNVRCVAGNPLPPLAFVDNGNGSITDQNTGLIWQKCADGQAALTCLGAVTNNTQTASYASCNALNVANFAGRNDWRLPNANELLSIVDHSVTNPSISATFPFVTPQAHWTSTSSSNTPSAGIVVSFFNGSLNRPNKATLLPSRCVAN